MLKLVKNKYYIGKTANSVEKRFTEHKIGYGSQWTRIYKPVKILKQFKTKNKFAEDMYTKKYMDKFGIDNVRGGYNAKIKLDEKFIL